jgi:hypothetical protein
MSLITSPATFIVDNFLYTYDLSCRKDRSVFIPSSDHSVLSLIK